MKPYDPKQDRDRMLLASIDYAAKNDRTWHAASLVRHFAKGPGVDGCFIEIYGADWRRLRRMRDEGLIERKISALGCPLYQLTPMGSERLQDVSKPIKRRARKA